MFTISTLRRKLFLTGVGLAFGASAYAGPGDPPVIVLPSAKAMAKSGVIQTQATSPAGPITAPVMKPVEVLPPPTAEPPLSKPVAPPLIAAPEMRPIETPKPELKAAAPITLPVDPPKETAPEPKPMEKVEVLPPPASLTPQMPLPVPGIPAPAEIKAAPLTAEPEKKPATPVVEKITDYAKATDVKGVLEQIAGLRKDVTALTGGAKAADIKALKDEIETLKKTVAALNTKPAEIDAIRKDVAAILAKPDTTIALKKDLADVLAKTQGLDGLKKDIAVILARPVADTKPLKDDLDALRKDIAALNTAVKENFDGKTVKGITTDGVAGRMKKIDDSLEFLTKKITTLETKLGETRTSAAMTQPAALPAVTSVKGTVRIVNEYPVPISLTINGIEHRVSPNHTLDIPTPIGTFKYQLVSAGGEITERALREHETVTLTIR